MMNPQSFELLSGNETNKQTKVSYGKTNLRQALELDETLLLKNVRN